MAVFLYFVEGKKGVKVSDLDALKLDSVLGGLGGPSGRQHTDGPGGKAGVMFCDSRAEAKHIRYRPEEQEWAKCVDRPDVWIGFDKKSPPTPADLARERIVDGHRIDLADGHKWLIGCARIFSGGTMLPEALRLGPGGELVKRPLNRFIEISKAAEKAWSQFAREIGLEGDKTPPKDSEIMDGVEAYRLAVDALSLNYRVGADEVSALELFDTHIVIEVMGALFDMPTIRRIMEAANKEDVKKKKTSD